MNVLVVPTIRSENIKQIIKDCEDQFDEIIVMEDGPQKTFEIDVHHYSWAEIKEDLKEDSWIISKRDSAIRCYGFLMAYRMGAKYIVTLDDDCAPDANFCQDHIYRLENTPKWTESIPGMRVRGLPYRNKGLLEGVVLNMGLWTNVPDLNALQALQSPIEGFNPPEGDRIIPQGQYFPLCGMNFAFKREITPLCYFPLMGEGQPYGRFDDIWFGVILKKICDHLGYKISVGRPFVEHKRASDAFKSLIKEAPGIEFNETFWQLIDGIKLTTTNPKSCMRELAENLKFEENGYLSSLGKAIVIWLNLFN
jgi:reversibly glycosylated polypeptide/UDP-arabinopyranose mutase